MQTPVQHRSVPASTAVSEITGSPNERSAFATLAGPHIEAFDCHITLR